MPSIVHISSFQLDRGTPISFTKAESDEEEELDLSSLSLSPCNSSLRSFVPLELANQILPHLSRSTLAAFCLVSFAGLLEAGPILYRDVTIHSEKGLTSYTCSMSLRRNSRLQPYLSISQTKTITFNSIAMEAPTAFNNLLVSKRSSFVAPRLAQLRSPLPLRSITITSTPSHKIPGGGALTTIFNYVFPHLSPTHLELKAASYQDLSGATLVTPEDGMIDLHGLDRAVKRWSGCLTSLRVEGWYPIVSGRERAFSFRQLATDKGGRMSELVFDFRLWRATIVFGEVIKFLNRREVFDMEGCSVVVIITKEVEELARGAMELMSEEQRGRLELRVVA